MTLTIESLGVDVSRETLDRLRVYLGLLEKWNPKINLVSKSTLSSAVDRHFRDSAQLLRFIPTGTMAIGDIGSGGGFPGVVLAILMYDQRNAIDVHLVESDQRKASFLRAVLRETGVSGQVHSKRIEMLEPMNVDVLTARALAPLSQLCGFAHQHLAPKGTALFPKGKTWGKEVEEARREWQFKWSEHTSVTDPESVILEIRDIKHG